MTLDTFMKSERCLHQIENPTDYANGFRQRKARGYSKEMVLKVSRTGSGTFYPALLGVLRDKDEEHRKLISSLYKKGIATEQVSDTYEEIYGKDYSKHRLVI